MNPSQRLFTITTTVIITCAVNIVFHQVKDNTKEVCETSEELGRRCTDELDSSGRCMCVVYACNSPGCNCTACGTIASCDTFCDEIQSPGLGPVILSSCIVTPVVFCLNQAFKWWHKPVMDAVSQMVLPPSKSVRLFNVRQHTGRFEHQTADRQDQSNSGDVAERRTVFSASFPYGLALAIAVGCIFVIASTSRPMSSRMTWEWVLSVIYSLVLKWFIIDPMKVLILAPVLSLVERNQWSQRLMKFLRALCLGNTDPHFQDRARRAIVLQRSLKSARLRLMRERIDAVRERDTAALKKAHEERVSMASHDDVRERLKVKHHRQRQEMLNRLAAIDQQMEELVEDKQTAYDCIANLDDHHSPSIAAARRLTQDFEEECQQAMSMVRQDQVVAAEVRLYAVLFLCSAMH